jgi:hypothetical protein
MAFVVALQVLNLSIFTHDFHPLHYKQKTVIGEFNEINSVVEYFTEVVLEHSNIFPEFKKEGSKDLQSLKHIDIKLINAEEILPLKQETTSAVDYLIQKSDYYNFLFYKEIYTPPPKA